MTGASGFLGGRLAEIMCRNDCRVRALIRESSDRSALNRLPVQLAVGELTDPRSMGNAVAGCDAVVHCAGKVTDWGRRDEFFHVNVHGTRNLLEACLAAGVKRVVIVSSLTVLGVPRRQRQFDESSPYDPNPRSFYAESKIETEKIALSYRTQGVSVVIVRPAGIWGPGDPVFLPRIGALAERGWLCKIGRGDNQLGMSHVDNVADGALRVIEAENPSPVYHIVDRESVTSAVLMTRVAEIAGWRMRPYGLPYWLLYGIATLLESGYRVARKVSPPALTRYGIRLFACDGRYTSRKARQELGYEGKIGFDEGIRGMADWMASTGSKT